jgi:hypothetical protein
MADVYTDGLSQKLGWVSGLGVVSGGLHRINISYITIANFTIIIIGKHLF